ncbi:hypothetical protein BDZ94DRAFT_1175100 [Collybia nuda]|uniref:Uncharacterized protein n=1 Tax=Collybia nuda TaxID=64659 RepID=A0A9P6CD06_9AGAR|nr:hypothetical protein BDZ94DRAFT_1175100 [Collybia nuda]
MSDSLTNWIQNKFTTLYESSSNTSGSQVEQSFDSTFSSTLEVIVNHVPTTREKLKKGIEDRGFAETRSAIEWKDVIEVSGGDNAQEVRWISTYHAHGIVAGSFAVTRSLKLRIRAGPAQTINYTVFSAKIVQDSSINDGDKRRIIQIFITSMVKAAPIHLQNPTESSPEDVA